MLGKLTFASLVLLFASLVLAEDYSNYDLAPGIIPGSQSHPTDPQWDLQFNYNVEALTGENGLIGVTFDGTYIWVSGRGGGVNPSTIYIISADGTTLVTSFLTGATTSWGVRDLTTDGTYIYGVWEQGMICWDPSPLPGNPAANLGTIPIPPGQSYARGSCYNPAGNQGNGSFYCGNLGEIRYEMDRNGNLIRTLGSGDSDYGMAWDDDDLAGPWWWIFSQSGGCVMNQIDPVTGNATGVTVNLTNSIVQGGRAGGASYIRGWDPQYSTFMCLGQGSPDKISGFEGHLTVILNAPAEPGNFTVSHHNTELRATLNWTNPSLTVGGEPLTDFTGVYVLRNGNRIANLTAGMNIGQPAAYTDNTIPAAGNYDYQIFPYNSAGYGLPASTSRWIGLDIPGEPSNVIATPDSGGALTCVITWTAPTAGGHGGYWPPGSWDGQKVYRNGVQIADLIGSNTTYTDLPPLQGWYTYGVSYYNASGESDIVEYLPAIYVGPIMSGSYDVGGGQNHFPNIVSAAAAINGIGIGGPVTFNVYPGIYNGEILLDDVPGTCAVNTITFHGIPGAGNQKPVVNSQTYGFSLEGVSHITVEGFEITQCADYGIYIHNNTVGDSSHNIAIKGNYFHDNSSYHCYIFNSHHIIFSHNEVNGGDTGIRIRYSPHTIAYNNMFYGQTAYGLYSYNTAHGEYYYNSIYTSASYSFRFDSDNQGGVCVNNIVVNYGTSTSNRCMYYYDNPTQHDYNCFYAPNGASIARYSGTTCATLLDLQSASGQEAHSIEADPMFINAADLHINSNSPCIDGGTPIASIIDDFDGEPRNQSTPCIGMDEVSCLRITLTLRNPPIIIPVGGGIFCYDVNIVNNTSNQLAFDAWTELILPNNNTYGPLLLRRGLAIPGYSSITRTGIRQLVPPYAPPGLYSYIGYVGVYPDSISNDSRFNFVKLFGDADKNHHNGWAVFGWEEEQSTLFTPTGYSTFTAFPNPFNQRSLVSFTLGHSGDVKLAIYDIAGREVACLADGFYPAGTHKMIWDASEMASGVYFMRLEAGDIMKTRKLLLVK